MDQKDQSNGNQSAASVVAALEAWLSEAAISSPATRDLIASIGRLCVEVTGAGPLRKIEPVESCVSSEVGEIKLQNAGSRPTDEIVIEAKDGISDGVGAADAIRVMDAIEHLNIGTGIVDSSESRRAESRLETTLEFETLDPSTHPHIGSGNFEVDSSDWESSFESIELKRRACDYFAENPSDHHVVSGEYRMREQANQERHRFFTEARQINGCFLWMWNDEVDSMDPMGSGEWRQCEALYSNLEESIRLIQEFEAWIAAGSPGAGVNRRTVLQSIAAAQSAVRDFMRNRLQVLRDDEDQKKVYEWLKCATQRFGVYLDQHMHSDSYASYEDAKIHRRHLDSQRDNVRRAGLLGREKRSLEKTVSWHVGNSLGEGLEDRDWAKIIPTLKTLEDEHHRSPVDVLRKGFDMDLLAARAADYGVHFAGLSRAADIDVSGREDEAVSRVGGECFNRDPELNGSGSGLGVQVETATPTLNELNAGEILEILAANHDEDVVVCLNSASKAKAKCKDPERLQEALEWLFTRYVQIRRGEAKANHLNLHKELKELCNYEYRTGQSKTTIGRFRDDYVTTYDDRRITITSHIGCGNKGSNRPIRVAFAWDAQTDRLVIGYLGPHQTTGASN